MNEEEFQFYFVGFISFDNRPKYNTNTTHTIHNSKYMKIKIFTQRKTMKMKDYIRNVTICI